MRVLRVVAVLAVVLVGTALPASAATTPADVVRALQNDPVFVQSDAEAAAEVDAQKVRAQLSESSRQIYVAVLPQRAAERLGSARAVAVAIGQRLPPPAVLVTLVGSELAAVATDGTGLGPGEAQRLVDATSGGATDRLVESVRSLQQVASGSSEGGQGAAGGSGDTGSGGSGGTILGVLALLGLGGGGALLYSRRRRRDKDMEGMRADVESLYNRLGADVSGLHAGDDAVARQALADAAERYNATGALLAHADTPGEFAAARRTAVEGLVAARTARGRLGLDPGPEIPLPPADGPVLSERQRVRVGDEEYEGSPSYEPGRGHYYGGGMLNGSMVPGGWYAFPFWQTMLMGSVLTGGFGGFGGGGYERGYEEGVEDARESFDVGWGGGGGGDFGGWGGGGGGSW